MCGRASCTLAPEKLLSMSEAECWEGEVPAPTYNAGPTSQLPVLMLDEGNRRILTSMQWGLHIPSMPQPIFNARYESVESKGTFKSLWEAKNRCILLIDGFYEWKRRGTIKEPYFIALKDKKVLEVAALYKYSPEQVLNPYSFTVLTMPSSEELSWLHERMPIILDSKEKKTTWISQENLPMNFKLFERNGKQEQPLEIIQVSSLVNSVRNNSADCRKPLATVKQEALARFFPPSKRSRIKGEEIVKKEETTEEAAAPRRRKLAKTEKQRTIHAFFT